jgi:hypothetical protein
MSCSKDNVDEVQYFNVTFISNMTTEIPSLTVTSGAKIDKPNIQREGYQLLGWYLESQFITKWNFETNTVLNHMTLWAKWEEIIVEETITIEEMLVKLKSSIYQEEMNVDEGSGLSDISAVGVNLEQLEETRYPVLETSAFTQIFYVSDYGLSPSANDNTNAFKALLNEVSEVEGLKAIYFEEGTYKFVETITFLNIDDLYLVGNNTEWVMLSWQTIMRVVSSNNFHINNIDFDYAISPTISGTIASVDSANSTVNVLVDDEFDLTNFRYNNGKINFGNYMEYVYDDYAKAYIPDANGMLRYNSTGDNIRGIKDSSYNHQNRILTVTFDAIQGAFKAPEIGKVVSIGFTMYEHSGFIINNTKDFFMETVNIYTTPGMSIRTETSENVYLNRTNIMLRPGSKRLMTATADGFHAADTIGEIVISNSIYEASHDDSINIKTFYFKVDTVFRNKVTLNMTTTEVRIPINIGDQLEFFEGGSFTSKAIRTVVDVEAYGTSFEITLDQNLSTGLVSPNDLVGNLSRIPRVTIENSIFRNKRNRGILAQFRDSTIRNCAFYNILHGPLMVHAAFDVFAEAIVPQNIVIENNKFINNNQARGLSGDVSVFRHGGQIVSNTIRDITIENNYFYQSSYHAVFLRGTGGVDILNNVFQDVARLVFGDVNQHSALSLNHVVDTKIIGNLSYMTTYKVDFAFIRISDDFNTIKEDNIYHNIDE